MRTSVFVVVFAGFAAAGQVQAQPRPAEGDCRVLSQTYGPDKIWWGRFSGGREPIASPLKIETYTSERCFTSAKVCDGWLYELQSKYQEYPRWNECRRGYTPGAPVRPAWAPKR